MPTYSQPGVGQAAWGGDLNTHLGTLTDPLKGGINTSSSSTPVDGVALSAVNDEGYTYVIPKGDASGNGNRMMKTIGGVDTAILENTNTWVRNINDDGITPSSNPPAALANDLVHIMDNGYVGVGTDAPTAPIQVSGSNLPGVTSMILDHNGSSPGQAIAVGDMSDVTRDTGMYFRTSGKAIIKTGGGGDLQLADNTDVNMHIEGATGYVGVGNTAPEGDVHVHDDGGAAEILDDVIVGQNVDYVAAGLLPAPATGAAYVFNHDANIRVDRAYKRSDIDLEISNRIEAGNNLFISSVHKGTVGTVYAGVNLGMSDGSALLTDNRATIGKYSFLPHINPDVQNALAMSNQVGGVVKSTLKLHQDGSLQFAHGSVATNPSFVVNGGNVGIGTTSPTSKLSVVGLATHLDEAAATTAGLATGDFYVTPTGEIRMKL